MPSAADIRRYVLQRVEHFSGVSRPDILECYLDRDLHIGPDDFVELCQELERTYAISLRPFFEDGVPMRRWWVFWEHPVARDVSVRELADHIVGLTARS